MNKLVEIFSAWGISFNPNNEQNELAYERIKICDSCENKTKNGIGMNTCGLCGCALKAKVFSPVYDACPAHKWLDVEDKYKNILQ